MTSRSRWGSRTDLISSGLHLARAGAAIKRAVHQGKLDERDKRELSLLRDALDEAASAIHYGEGEGSIRPGLRRMSSVGLAIGVMANQARDPHAERWADRSLSDFSKELTQLIDEEELEDPSPLSSFVASLVAYASRNTGGSGEVLRKAPPGIRGR